MQAFGTSCNPKIEQLITDGVIEATWTGPTGPISKILIGQQSGGPVAFTVAYVLGGTGGTVFRSQGAGTTFAADGLNWSNAKIYILQSSAAPVNFYVEFWR